MDKIWDRNPSKSEVIGRCGADEKKTNDHTEPTKVERLKKIIKIWYSPFPEWFPWYHKYKSLLGVICL